MEFKFQDIGDPNPNLCGRHRLMVPVTIEKSTFGTVTANFTILLSL